VLAGIVFAIEELSRSFEERTSGTVFTAVIVAGIGSMAVLGNYTYFGRTSASLDLAQAGRRCRCAALAADRRAGCSPVS